MMPRAERLALFALGGPSFAKRRVGTNSASSAVFAYQPDFQFVFLLVERLIEVNLYSSPTEMAKFTSYCP